MEKKEEKNNRKGKGGKYLEKENIFFADVKRNGEGKGGDLVNHVVSEMEVGSDDVDKDDTCDRGDGVTRLMGQ